MQMVTETIQDIGGNAYNWELKRQWEGRINRQRYRVNPGDGKLGLKIYSFSWHMCTWNRITKTYRGSTFRTCVRPKLWVRGPSRAVILSTAGEQWPMITPTDVPHTRGPNPHGGPNEMGTGNLLCLLATLR